MSFGLKNKAIIRDSIVGSNYSLTELQAGTTRALDGLDIRDPYTHADNRLTAILLESCEAARCDAEKAKREAARMAAMARQADLEQKRMAAEADAELAEIARKRAEDEKALQELVA